MPTKPSQPDTTAIKWGRRAVSIPLYVALAVFFLLAAPVWLLIGLALDCFTARPGGLYRLPRTRALAFFTLYFWCELVGVVAAALLWLVHAGGRRHGVERYVEANAMLQRVWTAALFHGAMRIFGMKFEVEGLALGASGPLLFFVRHSSVADTVLAAALVANPNRLLLRYVLKRELLWDPCLDIVGRRLPNAFVERTKPRSRGETAAIARLASGLDQRSAVLIYPEGTRFSPKKLADAQAALVTAGKLELAECARGFRNVLPPRVGGPLALIESAPQVDVVFVEHAGFEGAASFARFWGGALIGQTIHVRLRRVAAADIPSSNRERWLFEQWAETDRWISSQTRG